MRRKRRSYLAATRSEKMMFDLIIDTFTMMSKIIVFTVKGIYRVITYFTKVTKNMYALKKIGYSVEDMDKLLYSLSPRGFEVFIAELYKAKGYKVKLTPPSQDYGRDVIVSTDEGDIFIECKRWSKHGEMIGRDIAFKLLGSVKMFNAAKGIICTTGIFHRNAHEVARTVDNLELMDSDDILAMLMDLDIDKINRILLKAKNVS